MKYGAIKKINMTKETISSYINDNYRLIDLKEIARKHSLKISGSKDELIDRIINANAGNFPRTIYRPNLSQCKIIATDLCREYINAARIAVKPAKSEELIQEVLDACQDESPCWSLE